MPYSVEEQLAWAQRTARETTDPEQRYLLLGALADQLSARDEPAARTAAMQVGVLALEGLPDDDISLDAAAASLLSYIQDLFDHGGDIRLVPNAGHALAMAVLRAPRPSLERAMCAQHHAQYLFLFNRLPGEDGPHTLSMIEDQIDAYLLAVELAEPGDPFADLARQRLAFLGLRRYVLRRDPADLDRAIGSARAAANGHEDTLFVLGKALSLRFGLRTERGLPTDTADLDAAISAFRAARDQTRHPDKARLAIENLYESLIRRFRIEGNQGDLDEIIDSSGKDTLHQAGQRYIEEALSLRAQITQSSADSAMAMMLRWFDKNNPHDLANLVKREPFAVRAATARARGVHPDPALTAEIEPVLARLRAQPDLTHRVDLLDELVDALSGLEIATGSASVLDELIAASEQLIDAIHADDVHHRVVHQSGLGAALAHRYRDAGGTVEDARRGIVAMEAAAFSETLETRLRISVARAGGMTAVDLGDWPTATRLYRLAVELLNRLVPRHLTPADHIRLLRGFAGLVTEAASVVLNADDAVGALELLEQGRGLLIGRALDARDGATERLRAVADQLGTSVDPHAPRPPGAPSPVDRARELSRAWDEEVARIRARPGFADYLVPPRLADLAPLAERGPLITVVVGSLGANALILTTSGVDAVDLPGLTPEVVAQLVDRFWGPLRFAELMAADQAATELAQEPLREVLATLWELIAKPVLERIDPAERRVWWVPTGVLSTLPLHAAGNGRDCVLDRVISSYAPTLKVLRSTRAPGIKGRDAVSAISVADVPQLPPLRRASAEAQAAARMLRHGLRRPTRLDGAAATPSAVLGAIRSSGWLHLACHASTVADDPASSALHVHGGNVTAQQVLADYTPGGRLAYLSACSTAQVTSAALADEIIHLGSAFQIAGFRNVVGTLWRVDDGIAASVAESFYANLSRDESRAAEALHLAVRELRERYPLLPARWAPYIHLGG